MDNLDELMTAIAETEKYDNIRKQNDRIIPLHFITAEQVNFNTHFFTSF